MNTVPKIRFNSFEETWKSDSIENLVSNKSKKLNPSDSFDSVKCIEMENISQNTGEILGFIETNKIGSTKNVFDAGSVLFGKLRPYLRKFAFPQFSGVCSSEIWVLNGKKNLSNDFLFFLIQTDNFIETANMSSGSKMPRADWSYIKDLQVNIPSPNEQQKIATFFTTVDEKIQLLKKQQAHFEQYKKGVIQKIFSRELRFKDENGKDFPEWKLKKLGDIGNTFNGLTGKTKENFGNGLPYIQYKQIFDNSSINVSKCDLVQINDSEKQQRVQFGDAFFTVSSETPNEIGTASVLLEKVDEMYLNSFCFGFRPKSLSVTSPYFLRYLFRSHLFRKQIVKLAQGSTRYNMSKIELLKLSVLMPSNLEQEKIASFLSAIDEKIDHCRAQIHLTEKWKKGLLQQLFV